LAVQESEILLQVATSTLASLDVELETALRRIALAKERVALQAGQLERVRGLKGKGVASDEQLLDAEARELAAREAHQAKADRRRTLVANRATLVQERAGAEQRLAKARLDAGRTELKAPFRARVVRRLVGEGQFVARGAQVGEVYAVGRLEVRLPLTARKLSFVDLPKGGAGVRVVLSDAVGDERHTWEGRIKRAEGVVDRSSRQLAVIAELDTSAQEAAGTEASGGHEQEDSRGRPPIRPGTFLTGRIYGRVLPRAYVLPRSASMADDVVLIADADGVLRRRKLRVAWRTPESLVVTEGLSDGELLCTTPLVFAGESLKVNVRRSEPDDTEVPE
jgi:biotin carboxyl carrier protein